ncbi:MAG: T9SS type A sorting domain-containing protein, partial [Bacteroidia bacterium]
NTGGLVCSKSDAVVVNALTSLAAPTISITAPVPASSTICEGSGVINLSPSGTAGATQLQWLKNGTQVSLTNNLAAVLNVSNTAGIAANYTAKVKGANGCFSPASNVIAATIKPAAMPIITPAGTNNIILVCFGANTSASEVLTASVTSGTPTYAWYQPGTVASVGSGPTYTATITNAITSKTFNVKATYANACVRTSVNKVVRKNTACREDIMENELADFVVYPNPSDKVLFVEVYPAKCSEAVLSLSDGLGKTIMTQNIALEPNGTKTQLDLSNLASGVYHLSIIADGVSHHQKIIKD